MAFVRLCYFAHHGALTGRCASALQLTYPGTRISTLEELFAFANCADPEHKIHWNIESKINASRPHNTHGVAMFVTKQCSEFAKSLYPFSQIIVSAIQIVAVLAYFLSVQYKSLEWRSLIAMKVIALYFSR